MPAYPRKAIVADDEVGVYHCTNRCVRRAFLCGTDPLTGNDYNHRKNWIHEQLQHLASIFAIDFCSYAVMSNHLHVIVRTRPDLVQGWSDEEVALRWSRLAPARDIATGEPVEQSESDLNMILSDPERVVELRGRLASLSWLMARLCEPIARKANREDNCKGRFWEGRFNSQRLLDEGAVLACSVYVDLNPIRAGVAETPENSTHTSVFDRTRSMVSTITPSTPGDQPEPAPLAVHKRTCEPSPAHPQRPDAWLCELTIQESPRQPAAPSPTADQGPDSPATTDAPAAPAPSRRVPTDQAARASEQGFLPMSVSAYLSLVDWTGRQIRAGSRGTIPAELAPILDRLKLNGDGWIETVRCYGRWFKQVVGGRTSMKTFARQIGRAWFHGQRAATVAFRC
jgi:REP element-mobilizing transposase RayT